jgi:peroxiredoxin Q/BCP
MSRLEIGAKAPPFALANQAGKTISLKDFAGERFVIYFYPADDTPDAPKRPVSSTTDCRPFENSA